MSDIKWENYSDFLNSNGDTRRERDKNNLKNKLKQTLPNTLSYKKDTKINGETVPLIIDKSSQLIYKSVKSLPDGKAFYIGDYIDYGESTWIIIEKDPDPEIYHKGKMQVCSFVLRWQNDGGEILERHCILENATRYSTGISQGKTIDTTDVQYNLKLQLDDETAKLVRGKRFMSRSFNPNSHVMCLKTTQIDPFSYNYNSNDKMLCISVVEDAYNHQKDNLDLMLCDYKNKSDNIIPGTDNYCSIGYTGSPVIKSGGNKKVFTAQFVINGIVDTNITPVWGVVTMPGHEDFYIIEKDDVKGTLSIKATYTEDIVNTKILITLEDSDGLYHEQLFVEVGVL